MGAGPLRAILSIDLQFGEQCRLQCKARFRQNGKMIAQLAVEVILDKAACLDARVQGRHDLTTTVAQRDRH